MLGRHKHSPETHFMRGCGCRPSDAGGRQIQRRRRRAAAPQEAGGGRAHEGQCLDLTAREHRRQVRPARAKDRLVGDDRCDGGAPRPQYRRRRVIGQVGLRNQDAAARRERQLLRQRFG